MTTALYFAASTALGIVLGWIVFGGLWATVNGLANTPHPGRRILVSLLLRMALALLGFVLLTAAGGWAHSLAALLGFTLSRGWWMSLRLADPATVDTQ